MPQNESYRTIQLTKGQIARVSESDFEWLNSLKWSALWNKCTRSFYAVNLVWIPEAKTTRTRYMHRMILGLERGDKRQADHIDRDTLNNTRSNLRVATQTQNAANAKMRSDNTSGFKGVFFCKSSPTRPWKACARINGRLKHLGSFSTPEEASSAYIEFASSFHGEFLRSR